MVGLDNPLHIALVLIVVLMVFGAKRLPEMGKSMGQGLRGFKDSLQGHDAADESPSPMLTAAVPAPATDSTPVATPVAAPSPRPSRRRARRAASERGPELTARTPPPAHPMKIAIVGGGVSGLVTAYLLAREHEVTVFEAGRHAGGHTNTIRVDTASETHHVDTGFIVFNDRNYPNFERLLEPPRTSPVSRRTCRSGSATGTATSSTPAARRTACSPSARTS